MTNTNTSTPRLSEPNAKLGAVWGWSIPAVTTCPGATSACLTSCYAKRGNFVFPAIQNFFRQNYEGSQEESFVEVMSGLILQKQCRVFRIHISGDFYSKEYIEKWIQIVGNVNKRLGKTGEFCRFYFYTRSWRIKELLPALRRFAKMPHVYAWLSADRSSGVPAKVGNARIAYMSASDEERMAISKISLAKGRPHLIFRSCRKKTVLKKAGPVAVCPAENGQEKKVTCDMCRLCWKGFSAPKPHGLQTGG